MTARAISRGNMLINGSPNWVDLYTVDGDVARDFYAALLGWRFHSRFSLSRTADDQPAGSPIEEARATLLALCHDKPVAEIIERDDLFVDMLLPSRWYPYFYVVDIAATIRRVRAAGGSVVRDAHRRGTMATVATILDPSGAMIGLWQPGEQSGNAFGYRGGSLTWMELRTPNLKVARSFYGEVFDWYSGIDPPSVSSAKVLRNYVVFSSAVGPVTGAIETSDNSLASWYPSFSVVDLDQAITTAIHEGALAATRPHDLPIGRQCAVIDPEGAEFSLIGPRRPARANRTKNIGSQRRPVQ